MDNVRNKTVMITGGAAGLGLKYVEILLRNGARSIAMIDLSTSNGKETAINLEKEFGSRVLFIACDVTRSDDLKRAFDRVVDEFETIDILINNAGIFDDTRYKWERTIDVNVTALIRASYLALDHMGKHNGGGKGGLIVNVASILGLREYSLAPVYTASKHAVLGFSQSLAGLYDKTGVRILVMCPGLTKTELCNDVINKYIDFIDKEYSASENQKVFNNFVQSTDNVARAMLDLVQRGENGAVWVSEKEKPPYAVDFPHYSTRSLPV